MDSRVAIVTGASRGIGRAIALRLAADGRHVVCSARSTDALEALVEEIRSTGGSAEARACDVGDGDAVQALVDGVATDHKRLDILVNNAGITRDGLLLRMSDEEFDDVIRVNLRSVFIASRAAARPMMRGKFGRIITIGSISGINGNAGQANYAAAKAAVVGLMKTVAKEMGPKKITANVIAPGFIETDMTDALGPALKDEVVPRVPVRRLGQVEDIAAAAGYLASEAAGYVTGQVLVVDGGLSM